MLQRWSEEGGYREFLVLAIPLILSTGAWSIQHFVDRMFLTWHSPEAIAASLPAGWLNFSLLSLFIGTASYVNTFVAQYYGARRFEKIGASVWQGIFFSAGGTLLMWLWIPVAPALFRMVGHVSAVQVLEVQYFQILCWGSFFPIVSSALSGFFSGLGRTWTVMVVNFTTTAVNLVLDYFLIFGRGPFPEMGIRGAAIATVIAGAVSAFLFFFMFVRKPFRRNFATWKARFFDRELFSRLLRFGLPNGVQFFLDMLGFSLFVLLVGRLGTEALAATNIAFNINSLAFLPMVGSGIAVSILVGQRIGEGRVELAEKSVWSAAHLTFLYMSFVALAYWFFPELFLKPFMARSDLETYRDVFRYGALLLKFVAFYSLFDTMNIVFASAIKGAGDTRFVMRVAVALSWAVMVVPTYIVCVVYRGSLFLAWSFATAYIVLLGFIFLLRFLYGPWRSMKVIEEVPPFSAAFPPDAPSAEFEL